MLAFLAEEHCRRSFGNEFVNLSDVRVHGNVVEIDLLVRTKDGDEGRERKRWIRNIGELIERTYGVRIGITVRIA